MKRLKDTHGIRRMQVLNDNQDVPFSGRGARESVVAAGKLLARLCKLGV